MAKFIKSSGCTLSVAGTTIVNVLGGSISGWSRETTEVTSLSDTVKKYMIVIPDGGEISVDLNWDGSESSHSSLTALMGSGNEVEIVVTFTDSGNETFTCNGYLTGLDITIGSHSDQVSATATFKVNGEITVS